MWKSREPQAVYGNPNHVLVREATPTPIGRQRGLCHRLDLRQLCAKRAHGRLALTGALEQPLDLIGNLKRLAA
jgi:hypothetical protein